jgi:sporulation protein YlmC with PRC-barrel domain
MSSEETDIEDKPPPDEVQGTPLRSVSEVKGYRIHATDGHIGEVDDLLMNWDRGAIQLFAVDTRRWLPGKQVALAVDWVERFDWPNREVVVDLDKETIRGAPEYDSEAARMDVEAEMRLYNYYGRPRPETRQDDAAEQE